MSSRLTGSDITLGKNFSYNFIPLGSTVTIPSGQQMVVFQEIVVEGDLIQDGDLVVIVVS